MRKALLVAACALLAACGGTSISGKVAFEGEGDASGVVVSLVSPDKTEMRVTGSDGAYEFKSVGNGTYQLTFVAPDATEESRRAVAVTVKDGKAGEVPAVTLQGAGTVSGKVTADGPTGNLGIQVSVAGTTLSAMAADDGSFTLKGVPTGQRMLVATRGNYISSTALTVQRGAENPVQFTLGKTGIRQGTVKGSVAYWDARSASDIQVSVPGVLQPTNVASNGAFSLTLPQGEWDVVATAPTYPRQVVAHVKVESDGTQDVGIRKLTGYYRFGLKDPAQYSAYSRLFEDGVHALVSREGWENVTHSLVDLRTGEERMFLVEWNYVDDPTQWTATTNGQFLAYGQNYGSYDQDGSWHGYSEFNVFNTSTAQHFVARGGRDTYENYQELWSFSNDGAFFFGVDTQQLHRMNTVDGSVTSVAADAYVMKGDNEHFLAVAYGSGGNPVGNASFVTPSRADAVLANVQTDASWAQFGKYGLLMTDCDSGTNTCDLKVVNLLTGTAVTATGGKYARFSSLGATNHADWARIEGAQNAYLHLTDGTATAYPTGYTSGVANTAKINPSGDRVAFQVSDSNYSLYMTPMPPAAIPTTAMNSGADVYNYTWLSGTRFVSTSAANSSLIEQKNDTLTNTSGVVAGSVMVRDVSVTYRRASDKAQMALVGDTTIQLSDADPNSNIEVRTSYYPWGDFGLFQTKDKIWTGWTLYNKADGRFSTVLLKTGSTTPKRFQDVVREDGDQSLSASGMVANLFSWDGQEVAVDFETGIMKQTWENDVDEWNYGAFNPNAGQNYLMMSLLTGRTTQLYNSSSGARAVYETGLLKY